MTTPTPPKPSVVPKYNLREADYQRPIPGLLRGEELSQVTDKGLLYMIYRETRRTRVIVEVVVWLSVVLTVLAVLAFVVLAAL